MVIGEKRGRKDVDSSEEGRGGKKKNKLISQGWLVVD